MIGVATAVLNPFRGMGRRIWLPVIATVVSVGIRALSLIQRYKAEDPRSAEEAVLFDIGDKISLASEPIMDAVLNWLERILKWIEAPFRKPPYDLFEGYQHFEDDINPPNPISEPPPPEHGGPMPDDYYDDY